MGYINVFVTSGCTISVSNNRLLLSGERDRAYAIKDINSIMLESRECRVSSYALGELAMYDIVTYVCDSRHMPCAMLVPYMCHSRQLEMLEIQQRMSRPSTKRLWQSIIRAKIANEAICLDLLGIEGAEMLESIADGIASGDTGNGEAYAAAVYFKRLFGMGFCRDSDIVINAALNYTYAIVRGLIARSLAVYGFVPCLGIHHRSMLNSFNLADDVIEPFRAICDYYAVCTMHGEEELTTPLKGRLYGIVNVDVSIGGQRHSLSNAVDKMIVSLKECMTNGYSEVAMPILIGADMHRYE